MSRIMQVALSISMIILAGGFVNYLNSSRFSGAGVVAVILIVGVAVVVYKHLNRPASRGPGSAELVQRVEYLERRLTDIQDIVLSIDDRLARSEQRPDHTAPAS